jgi:ferredoxin
MAKSKRKIVTLNVDLNADMSGFKSAKEITKAHRKIAGYFASPLLLGPPLTDDLLEIVLHMFTEDEADLVQYLPPLRARTAEKIASLSGRSVADVRKTLDLLSFTKMVILAAGDNRKYAIIPIVPGTFEMALMTPDLSTRNSWHKKFAELFEQLWDSGYLIDYVKSGKPPVRYLPVGPITKTLNQAWPSDRLEEILEPYDLFAIGNCQCRMSMQLVGKGCDRPLENCVAIGPMAKPVIERGLMRPASREEVLETKHRSELEGCVTWMMNEVDDWRGNISCSCCGCCCHGLRTVNQFNAPGLISKPHFMPETDAITCTLCGKCVDICPMQAMTISDKQLHFNPARCIGCGLCVVACKFDAVQMREVLEINPPTDNWLSLLLKMAPSYLSNSVKVWAKRMIQ